MSGASIRAWWQGLAPRERTLVAAGTLVVLLVAGYLLLWEPPAQGIRKLQGDLPLLRAQGAELQGMADEAARLRSASGAATAIAPAERIAAVRRTLLRAGLWREGDAAAAPGAGAARGASAGSTVSTLTVSGTVTTVASGITARAEPPSVTAETNERVRVRFENIDYGVWVAWLAAAESVLAARAARVSVVALAPNAPVGHVRAEVVLDWTQPAAPPGAPRS